MEKSQQDPSHSISVVVPTTGDLRLPRLREALAQQSVPATEIIIVPDREKKGAAWARNQGIAKATSEYIAFLDDDCLPPVDWLENLLTVIIHYRTDVVGGTYEESDTFLKAKRSRQNYPPQAGPDELGLVGAGGNIMYRSSVLRRIQSLDGFVFNEEFRISQDWELIWRVRSLGHTVAFTPARVLHLKRVTAVSYIRMQFFRGCGIHKLNTIRKAMPSKVTLHDSLLWGKTGQSRFGQWQKLVWNKVLGPFDLRSFHSPMHFLLFWLGEKVQGLGFVWASIGRKINPGKPGMKETREYGHVSFDR